MYNMYFTITSRCNQCCTCCPYTDEDIPAPDMEISQIEDAVRKAIARLQETSGEQRLSVVLSGGEPTIHPEFPRMVGRLQKAGASVHVLSNAELLSSSELLHKMDQYVNWKELRLTTTIHSEIPEEHEEANRKKGSFERTVAGLHNADLRGAYVTVKHCVTGANYKGLNSFYQFVDKEFPIHMPLYLCGIDYVGIPQERLADNRIGLPQIRPALEGLFDLVEKKKVHRKVYATHIPLCWTDPYYWKYLMMRNPAFFYKAAGRTGEMNWESSSDSGTNGDICESCKVRNICMGTYKSAYPALGQEGFRPYE